MSLEYQRMALFEQFLVTFDMKRGSYTVIQQEFMRLESQIEE